MADRKPDAAANPAPGADEAVTALARVVARMVVAQSVSTGSASFRQIAVRELKVATAAEAAVIEAWLRAHPGS